MVSEIVKEKQWLRLRHPFVLLERIPPKPAALLRASYTNKKQPNLSGYTSSPHREALRGGGTSTHSADTSNHSLDLENLIHPGAWLLLSLLELVRLGFLPFSSRVSFPFFSLPFPFPDTQLPRSASCVQSQREWSLP
jgi:hypothetical protein